MQIEERVAKETGREYALRMIKKNIINLELEPGSLLSEQEIAAQLGVSRTPVREAFIELSKVQIVEIYPQRGSRVALIDYALVDEAGFIRQTMECAIVRLACEMAAEEDLKWLEDNLRLQEFYLHYPSPEHFLKLDNRFHQYLYKICNKQQCYELVNSMAIHFDRIRSISLNLLKDMKQIDDHWEIFKAIRDRDPDRAESALIAHLQQYQVDRKIISEKYPNYLKA